MSRRMLQAHKLLKRAAAGAVPALGQLVSQRDRLGEERDRLRREGKRLQSQATRLESQNRDLRDVNRRMRAAGSALPALVEPGAGWVEQDLDYLFVVTYGRSGSTLLQGLLSSIPGFLIRGENAGAVYSLYEFHTSITRWRERLGSTTEPTNPWFGIGAYSDDSAYREMRRLLLATVLRPEPDSRAVGFKEIRWPQDDLQAYIGFLGDVFPGARFIINTRDLDEVARSKWWAQQPDALDVLKATEERMLQLVTMLGADAYHLHYNDYVEDPSLLRGLFDWLAADFDEARVRRVLAQRHSY